MFKQLRAHFNFAYVCPFWLGIANIPSTLTTNVFNNNTQHLLHINAPVVITYFPWFIISVENFDCTELRLWIIWEIITSNSCFFTMLINMRVIVQR
jgi:hypothetical protein